MKGCRPLTDAEIAPVHEQLGKNQWPARDRALFHLGCRSGFRISELLSLRLCDIVQTGKIVDRIDVQRDKMKGKLEGRGVPLHPQAREALKVLIEDFRTRGLTDPQTFLFLSRQGANQPINRRTAWWILRRACRAVGLTGKLGTHFMRKTFAKRVYDKLGHDLIGTQKALGHRDIKTTQCYLGFAQEDVDDAIMNS